MADVQLPPDVVGRLVALERQVENLTRAQNPPPGTLFALGDVHAQAAGDGSYLRYQRSTGKWLPADNPTQVLVAEATGSLTLTTSYADVTGASVPFTTTHDGAEALVIGVFDFTITASGPVVCLGHALLDGGTMNVDQAATMAEQAIRASVAQTWWTGAMAAGAHTIKLQAKKTANAGTATAGSGHTTLAVLLRD